MKKYQINEHGVCINPDTETIFNDGKFFAKIHLAQNKGLWAYGYYFGIKGTGVGCFTSSGLPAFGKYRDKFQSPDQARQAAIKIGIKAFERAVDRFPVGRVIDALKRAQAPQLSLF